MAATTRILKDIAVFINTVSFVGMVKELDLPNIERTTAAHETLAMLGTINVGVGKEPMEMRIAWEGHSKAIARVAYNTQETVDLMIRGVIEDLSGPVIKRESVVWMVKGVFRSKQGGNFSPKALATHESMIDLVYYREEIDGEVMTEQDFANNIDKVNGRNLNEERNRILGI